MNPAHRAALTLLLSGLLSGPAAFVLQAQESVAEPVLVELRLGRIAERTVEAYRLGEEVLIPIRSFFDLAELRIDPLPDGTLEGLLQPGNLRFILDPVQRTLQVGREKTAIRETQLVATGQEIFVGAQTLRAALGLEWAVSWPDLEVTLLDPTSLPVARRMRREAMLASRMTSGAEPELHAVRYDLPRSGIRGLVVDYSLLAPTSGVEASAYATSVGLDVFGGAFSLGLQSQAPGEGPRADVSWTGVWRESRWLSQTTLGDGYSTGPRGRSVRGATLSNSPYVRPSLFGSIPFTGQLGSGWTLEAYRGGRLIAFDSVNALGQFSFDLPVQYGENPVDFVAYGPFGEIREFNQAYRIRPDLLQQRTFEYGLSAGACRTDRCEATANVDLRYGLSNRWSARAGLDQFWRDSVGNLSHPYVGITGAISNRLTLEAEAVANAVLRGAVRLEPSVDLQLLLEANQFVGDATQPILTPDGRENQFTLYGFWRPIPRLGATYLEGSLDRVGTATGHLNSGRIGVSSQWAGVRVIPSVRFERQVVNPGSQFNRTFVGINSFMLPRPGLPGPLGNLTARGNLEFEAGTGMSNASVFLGMPLLRGLRTEAGTSWYNTGGATFTMLIAAELPTVRSYTTVTAGHGAASGSEYISGSAIYNPGRSGMDFSGTPARQRGGLTGRVFLDQNADGEFQEGEPLIPGARVIIGRGFGVSDSKGRYRFWDLVPFEPTPVHVDSATLPSPLWVPSIPMAAVELSPNRYRRLDIPIVPGGVIEGRVVWAGGSQSPRAGVTAGVVLTATHKATGEVRTLSTFSDGSFYAIGIRPGEWTLSVETQCLAFLEAASDPIGFTIHADEDGESLSGLEIVIR
ncbi:MAG: hypothetical protein OEW80_00905 [Gemmatimonadota bacterium]|nr:hypothetical protein [Gemmatimonadota bacterium]